MKAAFLAITLLVSGCNAGVNQNLNAFKNCSLVVSGVRSMWAEDDATTRIMEECYNKGKCDRRQMLEHSKNYEKIRELLDKHLLDACTGGPKTKS